MATSEVAVANLALQKLGAKRIESLTQDHPNARSIAACFDDRRDQLLRKYPWSFAIARDSIAADASGPTWGDWNRYTKPNDFIRLLLDDESGYATDFKIEGDYILSANDAPLEIRYIARIEDVSKFDASFTEALAASIAFWCCEEITGSTGKQDRARADMKDAIDEAMRTGAIEKPAQDAPEDDWVTARY
jgi:hypothetical protein